MPRLRKSEYIEKVKNNLAASEKALEDFLKDNAAHDEHIEEYGTKLTEMNNEISSLRQRAMVCASGISELAARSETVKQNLAVKKQNGEQNKRELDDATAFIAELDQKIESEANTVKGYEFKLNKRKEKLSVSDKELADIELKIKEKEQNAKLLEDLEKNMDGFAGSVKSVMRLASNGTLRGIHGTVASLISVPKEYTVAVETALSYALQNIVAENEDCAKRAINILKSQNAGRATFLPLSTIKGNAIDTKGVADCGGFVGVASSLVGYDKKYTGIVENLLGRIVVCEDLDDAVNMARKNNYRFRIVTLDGQIINAGGSLTGGSTVKSSGILSRRNDIEALRRQAQELTAKAEKLRSENADLKAEIASLEADYLACASELTTMKEDRADADTRSRILATTMEETEKAINEFNDELEKACVRIAELKGEQNKSDEARAQLEAKAQELEKQLDSTMQSKDELRTRRHKLTEEISGLKMEIFGAEKEAESLENAAEELRRRRENQSGRFAELKAESEKLEAEIADINKQIEDILASKDEVRRSVARFDSEMAEITAEKLDYEKQANTRRGEEREILSRREDVSKEMARLEERKIAVQTEYDSIIAKLWDEYELTKSEAMEIAGEIESITAAQRSLAEIKSKIRALGSVNVEAIDEYKEVKERYEFLSEQIADVEKSRDELLKIIGDLTSRMREIFAESFTQINKNFGEVFVELFGGGRASLKLTDEGDVLESGIDILVEPPER